MDAIIIDGGITNTLLRHLANEIRSKSLSRIEFRCIIVNRVDESID